MAVDPATKMVLNPIKKRQDKRSLLEKEGRNFKSKTTPAVTKVEEWTRALTGVGAAIAAGSQAEIGAWALFVIATTKRNKKERGTKKRTSFPPL